MLGLLLRVFFRFYIGFFLILNIASTLSDVVIETDVGSTDKITFPNTTCQVVSGKRLCQSFGARLQNGERCSCLCPEDTNTFGFDGETCKCLSNNISYGGCPNFSQIDPNILQRNSTGIKLFLPSKNCSLEVLYRQKNGSWIMVENITGIITFSQSGISNGSFVYYLKVSNSIDDFQGTVYNVIVQCQNHNGTCLLLKLPRKTTCPLIEVPTRAPTNSASPMTNVTVATNNSNTPSSLSDGELAAIIVSCLLFLAIIALVLFLWIRRKRDQAIRNERRESNMQMTGGQDDEERNLKTVVFSRPKRASTQRKESANLGFEPDDKSTSDGNYEDPDYDLPIDEKHSIINDIFNKIKRPRSVKKTVPQQTEKEDKLDNQSDEYQIMENLENPHNPETTVVYENTNGLVKEELKPQRKQPSYKKIWRPKKKKEKKSGAQGMEVNGGQSNESDIPELTVREKEIPNKKIGDNLELENVYENNEAILQHKGPSRNPIHENRAGYSNNVLEEEEGPPPPPRSTSLEKVLDEPKNYRPIPSPRMKNKLPDTQANKSSFNKEIEKETENDPSELYENTRKGSFPMPVPRAKK